MSLPVIILSKYNNIRLFTDRYLLLSMIFIFIEDSNGSLAFPKRKSNITFYGRKICSSFYQQFLTVNANFIYAIYTKLFMYEIR